MLSLYLFFSLHLASLYNSFQYRRYIHTQYVRVSPKNPAGAVLRQYNFHIDNEIESPRGYAIINSILEKAFVINSNYISDSVFLWLCLLGQSQMIEKMF